MMITINKNVFTGHQQNAELMNLEDIQKFPTNGQSVESMFLMMNNSCPFRPMRPILIG